MKPVGSQYGFPFYLLGIRGSMNATSYSKDRPSRHLTLWLTMSFPDARILTRLWRVMVRSGNPLRVALLRDPSVLFAGSVSALSSHSPSSRVEGNS